MLMPVNVKDYRELNKVINFMWQVKSSKRQ